MTDTAASSGQRAADENAKRAVRLLNGGREETPRILAAATLQPCRAGSPSPRFRSCVRPRPAAPAPAARPGLLRPNPAAKRRPRENRPPARTRPVARVLWATEPRPRLRPAAKAVRARGRI